MYIKAGSDLVTVIKAITKLEPGNADSFVTAEVGGRVYDSIQTYRNADGSYHVEFIKSGSGDPKYFDGNEIFALEDVDQKTTIKLFTAVLKDHNMPLPKGVKNITVQASKA